MKKKVRVYKPGGEAAQPTQEQIINYIAQRMTADDYDGDTDTLKEELVQSGIDEDTADQYIEYVNENLDSSEKTFSTDDAAAAAEEEQATSDEEQALLDEQNAAEEQARQEQLAAMYDTNIDTSADEAADDEMLYMQRGGSKPSKRSFVNKYTRLAKKQMGGDATNHTQGPDTKPAKQFLSAVANTAQDAILKQEAEQVYNSIYGVPQVGVFQDGGIHQEEQDVENPLHHLSAYGADTRHIFSDDMYTQNDVAAMEQYGGNTGQGLYKFIGGGDNESADEQYQDADLDYQQYAKHGGALYKAQTGVQTDANNNKIPDYLEWPEEKKNVTNTDTEDWKAKYDELVNQNKSQEQQRMMQQMMLQQFMGSSGNNNMYRNLGSPIRMGMRYNQAVGNPYYTASGQRANVTDFSNMLPTSVDVTKKGLFGRPKEFTVNYGYSDTKTTNKPTSSILPEIKMPEDNMTTKSDNQLNNQTTVSNTSSYPQPKNDQPFAKFLMDTRIPGIRNIGSSLYKTVPYEETQPKAETYYPPMTNRAMRQEKRMDRRYDRLTKEAYGGDISIPDLYHAQVGVEVPINPNDNNMSYANLNGFFTGTGAVDKKGNSVDASLPQSMQPELLTIDPNQKNREVLSENDDNNDKGISQKYKAKSELIINPYELSIGVGNFAADVLEQADRNKKQNQLLSKLKSSENIYGIDDQYNKGTYDPNSGLFRPDQMGFNGVVKYGGGIYAMGGNTEDEDEDIQYMTQEEIDDFLANGGELEYL